MTANISDGTVHKMPNDLKKAWMSKAKALSTWESLTPLARNEWICLVVSAKKDETRMRRIGRTIDQLKKGRRRPCCWAGCPHRS